jgi:hypothetical protein
MRIIFSRKGFDSQYGKVPSPILPDGRMVPLPIPSPADPHCMRDLRTDGIPIGRLVSDLTRGRIGPATRVHLDPDLYPHAARSQRGGWHPAFGQAGAAQTHLARQCVGRGDLFLFFGWFRHVERSSGRWRYAGESAGFHALFGWLQVDEAVAVSGRVDEVVQSHPWLRSHPHVVSANRHRGGNTIYVATQSLRLDDVDLGLAGGGLFTHLAPTRRLSAEGRSRSWWRLPRWFYPSDGRPALSYHGNPARWMLEPTSTLLQVVAKGQEFVLHCAHYPEASDWLRDLFHGAHGSRIHIDAIEQARITLTARSCQPKALRYR